MLTQETHEQRRTTPEHVNTTAAPLLQGALEQAIQQLGGALTDYIIQKKKLHGKTHHYKHHQRHLVLTKIPKTNHLTNETPLHQTKHNRHKKHRDSAP